MATFTPISLVTPLDLTNETLVPGNREVFVLKMNSLESKLQAWTTAFSNSIASINTLGDEYEVIVAQQAVDISGKFDKTGGTISGSVNLAGDLFFESSLGNIPQAVFKINSVEQGQIIGFADRLQIQRNNSVYMRMFDSYTLSSVPIQGVSTQIGDNVNTLTTKDYVDTQVISGAITDLAGLNDVTGTPADGQALVWSPGLGWHPATINTSVGTQDHGAMQGLADDDHTQYYNQTRGDARYLKLTGGTIDGDASIFVNSASFNGKGFVLRVNGISTGSFITGPVSNTEINHYVDGGIATQLVLSDIGVTFNKPVICTKDPTLATHLTRKDYVDDNFVKLVGSQLINGDMEFNNGLNTNIGMNAGSNAIVYFNINGFEKARVQATTERLTLVHNHTTGGTTNEIRMYDEYTQLTKVIKGMTPVSNTDLTTKLYVDEKFVTLNTGQVIAGAKTFTSDVVFDKEGANTLTLQSSGNYTSYFNFRDDSQIQGQIISIDDRFIFRRPDTGDGLNELSIYSTYSKVNKDIRCANMGSDPTSLVTKAYADAIGAGGAGSMAAKDFWTGTQAQYNALPSYDSNTIYFASA